MAGKRIPASLAHFGTVQPMSKLTLTRVSTKSCNNVLITIPINVMALEMDTHL